MKTSFEETKIWLGDRNAINTFVDFKGSFSFSGCGNVVLKITCDGAFSFTVNGALAGFGESTDFPDYKEYHTFDITKFCKKKNEIVFTVWHYGVDTQTYINAPAFLAFCIKENGKTVLRSDKSILARVNPYFDSKLRKKITNQLGFSYLFDNTAKETAFVSSEEFGEIIAHDRIIANLKLNGRKRIDLIALKDSILVDMFEETVGFLDIEVFSSVKQKLTIAYGEHLRDGHAARRIGERDFSVEIVVKTGENKILVPFRRLAGKYLEVFAEDVGSLNIRYIGVRPTVYPLRRKPRKFALELDQRIYDVSVYTLECSMHEHYEDCPWREQALYTMDSRNQMLCGYFAFFGTKFQRHSLILIAKSLRKDGLLSICAPSGLDAPIPFFNLVYPIQVAEYVKISGDRSVLKKVGKDIHTVMNSFHKRIDDSGLIPNFPKPFWNFYEWSKGNGGSEDVVISETGEYKNCHDLILNCMYVYAAKFCDELFGTSTDTSNVKTAIKKVFYDEETHLYKSSDYNRTFSQLGNSLAVLIGLGDEILAEKLLSSEIMTPITLSMTTFLYDALLLSDEKKYSDFVLSDIRRRYKKMLDVGATTFWETELGAKDFDGAGSLCHGWAAMPIYYFNRLKAE